MKLAVSAQALQEGYYREALGSDLAFAGSLNVKGMKQFLVATPGLSSGNTCRLILFLQQSSVEWCSSLWMHIIQEVDPNFHRTVVVSSKFDNRLKEFGERWEVDRYLSAAGYLNQNVQPYFVALPKVSSHEEEHTAERNSNFSLQTSPLSDIFTVQ